MFSVIRNSFDMIFDTTIGKLWISRIWDGFNRELPSSGRTLDRVDFAVALGFGLLGVLVSIWGFSQTNRVPEIHTMFNLWMDADVARVAENMTTTSGDHARTTVHPLFSILVYPFGALLTLLGVGPLTASKTLVVVIMGANAMMFSLTTRLLDLPRLVSSLFTVLFVTTASFLFWSASVETYPFSCFGVVCALFLMLRVKNAHWGWWVTVNVLTLGFLITNWVFALIAMAVRLKLKPFVGIALSSFFLVVVLAVVQNATFEKAALFVNPQTLLRESHYLQPEMEARGIYEADWKPMANLRSIYSTTVVAMPTYVDQQVHMRLTTTNQNSGFPAGEIVPVIATISWIVLFGMGIWGAIRRNAFRLPVIGAGGMLLAQTLLHSVYGGVTFLYSLSFMPLLILFASMAWFAPFRRIALGLAGCVIVFAGINNERRLQETVEIADCMSELESVQKLQTWELIRNEEARDLVADLELQIDTNNLCDLNGVLQTNALQP